MNRARRQLWFIALLFVAIGIMVGVAYQKYRAGDIRAAEGRREYDAGRFDLAEASYLRAAQLEPNNAGAWYWLGMSRKNQGHAGPAAEALAKATALRPDRPAWWVEFAEALQWAEQFVAAERAWQRAIDHLPPNDARIRLAKVSQARCIGAEGQTDRAAALLREMLTRKEDRQVRFTLAEVLAWGGRFEESAKEYRRALETRPEK